MKNKEVRVSLDDMVTADGADTMSKIPGHAGDYVQQVGPPGRDIKQNYSGSLAISDDFLLIRSHITPAPAPAPRFSFDAEGWLGLRVRLKGTLIEVLGQRQESAVAPNASFINYGSAGEYSWQPASGGENQGITLLFRRSFVVSKLGENSGLLSLLDNAASSSAPMSQRHWLQIDCSQTLQRTANKLFALNNDDALFALRSEQLALELFAGAVQQIYASDYKPQTDLAANTKTRHRMERARALIDRDLAAAPGLAQLSQALEISERTLSSEFRQVSGQSVKEYIQARRMEQAMQLLADGKPVGWVANAVGYQDQGGFTKVFKRYFGVLPRQVVASAQG